MSLSPPRKIAIVGAGLAGLTTAFRLQELKRQYKFPLEIKIFDSSSRPGGIIQTVPRDGFLLEQGPDSFLTEKPWAINLCKRLGLEDQIIPTQEAWRRSFICRQNRLMPIPKGFYLVAPTSLKSFISIKGMSMGGKIRMFCERWIPSNQSGEDESVSQFIGRRFGNEALELWGRPMLGGIYAGDTDLLSAQSTIPHLYEMEKKYGSVTAGLQIKKKKQHFLKDASGPRYGMFVSLRKGMQELITRLCEKAEPCEFLFSNGIEKMEFRKPFWVLEDSLKQKHEADVVCLAIPAYRSAKLFSDNILQSRLNEIPYGNAATLNMAFRCEDVEHPLDGFGFVVSPGEGLSMIGCTFSHRKFEDRVPDGRHILLRAFLGGDSISKADANSIEEQVLAELAPVLGIKRKPLFLKTQMYPYAMPQYTVGHRKRLESISLQLNQHPGCFLTGNAYDGIGIPDTIFRSEACAVQIMDFLSEGR